MTSRRRARRPLLLAVFLIAAASAWPALEAAAVPVPVHRSQANFMSGGGTRVIGCGGEGCPSGAFNIGDVSGDTEWSMVTRIFRDAAVPNTAFRYTLFNDVFAQPITSFHIANNGHLGVGSAPAGWTFSQDGSFWSWSTTTPTSGIAMTESLGGFNVLLAGSPAIAFTLASINLADGTLVGNGDWRGPGPAATAPEPLSLLLFGSGLAGLRYLSRRPLAAG